MRGDKLATKLALDLFGIGYGDGVDKPQVLQIACSRLAEKHLRIAFCVPDFK
jgi:hypothetical protein